MSINTKKVYHIHVSVLSRVCYEEQDLVYGYWARIVTDNPEEIIKVTQEMYSKMEKMDKGHTWYDERVRCGIIEKHNKNLDIVTIRPIYQSCLPCQNVNQFNYSTQTEDICCYLLMDSTFDMVKCHRDDLENEIYNEISNNDDNSDSESDEDNN